MRSRKQLEESIFLVGTPHCLVSEGLADLGLEILWPENRGARLAAHLRPLGVKYEPEVAEQVSKATTTLAFVGTNMALRLHGEGVSVEDSIAYEERWGLTTHDRAAKHIQFVTHPVWRAYTFCYTEGLRLCRAYTQGDPLRFRDLLTEQLTTADLVDA